MIPGCGAARAEPRRSTSGAGWYPSFLRRQEPRHTHPQPIPITILAPPTLPSPHSELPKDPYRPDPFPDFPTFSTAMNASCGISTFPTRFIRLFPSACFCSNFLFRVTSPP